MPHFKPKASKKFKVNKKMAATIDSQHHEKMSHFNTIQRIRIPKLRKQRTELRKKLDTDCIKGEERREADIPPHSVGCTAEVGMPTEAVK